MNEEELHEDASMLNMSLDWWKREANTLIGKLEVLEERMNNDTATNRDREQFDEVIAEAEVLIARGQIEDEYLTDLFTKIEKFNEKNTDDAGEA